MTPPNPNPTTEPNRPPSPTTPLPPKTQLVATNVNDILHRFFSTGEYHKATVTKTASPSMDISISSNFERCVRSFIRSCVGCLVFPLRKCVTG
jgi:hypothetical protein